MELPIIDDTPVSGMEDMAIPFPVNIQLPNSSPNDIVEIRLINVLSSFTSALGTKDGDDLIVSAAEASDVILQPFEDLAGEFSVPVQVTITEGEGTQMSITVDIPITLIPVPDEPSISVEATCFDTSDVNGTFTMFINVTSGDDDQSELVSVQVEGKLERRL